jgi:hypothetical protein
MHRGLIPLLCLLAAAPARGPVRPLPFFYDLYTFRGGAGSTTVVAAFAIPAGQLERESRDGDVFYRFDVTLVLADTALKSVSRTDDSVVVATPRSLRGDHLLHTQIEVQAPPSTTTLQRVIMTDASTPGIGQLYGSAFPIPDYSGTELMLSDVALGDPYLHEGWKRGDVTLALLPTSQFPEGSFEVYYEIYNLPEGHRYTTELSVESLEVEHAGREGAPGAVRARFDGTAAPSADAAVPELRRVDTSLSKGRYRLTVTVTDDDTGKTVSRSREFQVRGGSRRATLVPALPRGPHATSGAGPGVSP